MIEGKDARSTADRGALTLAAFKELFFLYSEELHAYATRLLSSSAEADDIVQVVFENLWRRREEWQVTGSPRAYLYQAVRHRVFDELKRHRVRRRHAEQEQRRLRDQYAAFGIREGEVPGPDAWLEEQELRTRLGQALKSLPARQQEAFVLVNQQGLSYDDAAAVMGIARSTVAVHIHKALQQLHKVVDPVHSEE